MDLIEIGVERVLMGRKRYSGCSAKLDMETITIHVYCKKGFIFKKDEEIARISRNSLDLYSLAKKGSIEHEGIVIILTKSGAEAMLSHLKQYIVNKTQACLSTYIEKISEVIIKRSDYIKYIEGIARRPRETMLELSEKLGIERISEPSRDPIEEIHRILSDELKSSAEKAVSDLPGCPDTPSRIIENIYRLFMTLVEIQDSIYRGDPYEEQAKMLADIEVLIGGLTDQDKKALSEELSKKDITQITSSIIKMVKDTINKNIGYIVEKELS